MRAEVGIASADLLAGTDVIHSVAVALFASVVLALCAVPLLQMMAALG